MHTTLPPSIAKEYIRCLAHWCQIFWNIQKYSSWHVPNPDKKWYANTLRRWWGQQPKMNMILHILGVGIYANDGHLPIRVVGPLHNFRCPQLKVVISALPTNQSPNRNIKAGNSHLRRGCHFRQTHETMYHRSTLVSGTNTTPTRLCKHRIIMQLARGIISP